MKYERVKREDVNQKISEGWEIICWLPKPDGQHLAMMQPSRLCKPICYEDTAKHIKYDEEND